MFGVEALAPDVVAASIVAGVPVFKWISEEVEKKRKERREKKALELSQSADLQRLAADGHSRTVEEWRDLAKVYKERCEEYERKIERIEQNHSLPRPLMQKIYLAARKMGTQIEIVQALIKTSAPLNQIEIEMEILEQRYNDLDVILP